MLRGEEVSDGDSALSSLKLPLQVTEPFFIAIHDSTAVGGSWVGKHRSLADFSGSQTDLSTEADGLNPSFAFSCSGKAVPQQLTSAAQLHETC